jgi:hypothetical protein
MLFIACQLAIRKGKTVRLAGVLPAYDSQVARAVELDGLKPSSLDLPREQISVHWPINGQRP